MKVGALNASQKSKDRAGKTAGQDGVGIGTGGTSLIASGEMQG